MAHQRYLQTLPTVRMCVTLPEVAELSAFTSRRSRSESLLTTPPFIAHLALRLAFSILSATPRNSAHCFNYGLIHSVRLIMCVRFESPIYGHLLSAVQVPAGGLWQSPHTSTPAVMCFPRLTGARVCVCVFALSLPTGGQGVWPVYWEANKRAAH